MPDTSGSVDLSSAARTPEEEEALRALQNGEKPEAEEAQGEEVLCTFLVVVDTNGNPRPVPVNHPQFNSLVEATPDLIYGAAATLMKDLAAVEGAQATAGIMAQQAQAMMSQQQDAMLRARLAAEGGVRT